MVPAISRPMEKKKKNSATPGTIYPGRRQGEMRSIVLQKGFYVKKSKDQQELGGRSEQKSNPVHFSLEGEIRPK